jgi:hypothetical protein
MSARDDGLTPRQERALAALLSEPTVEKAAAKAGVGYRTLKGWLAQPAFLSAWRAARRRVVEEAVVVLQKLTTAAAVALGEVVTNKRAKAADRVRAAVAIFDREAKAAERTDLQEQLDELRARLDAHEAERWERRRAT